MSSEKAKVFISYSRADAAFADEIVKGLEWAGFDATIDRESIVEGEDWRQRLGNLIADADTVVTILSPDSVRSAVLAWEVEEAHRLAKRLLPVLYRTTDDDTVPPRLAALNYVRFDPLADGRPRSFMEGLSALTRALETDLAWLREHTRLLARAREWDEEGRPATRLLRGTDIAAAKEWLATRPPDAPGTTELHHAFIEASEREEARRTSEERRRLEEIASAQSDKAQALDEREVAVKKLGRRTFLGIAGTSIFAGGAGVAGYGTVRAQQRAAADRLDREAARLEAEAARLETEAARQALEEQEAELSTWKRLITEDPSSNPADLEGGPVEIVVTEPRSAPAADRPPPWHLVAVGADRSPADGSGVVMAHIGTGVDPANAAFAGMELIQKDFTGEGNGDRNGHGTSLASVAFGKQVDGLRVGVATGARRALVAKVLGASGVGSLEAIAVALDWVTKFEDGIVDVVFMGFGSNYPAQIASVGAGGSGTPEYRAATLLRRFLQELRSIESTSLAARARGKGITFVTTAGNDSFSQPRRVPTTMTSALAKGFVSVGSVAEGPDGYRVSDFSSGQPTLCAPGAKITSARLGGGVHTLSGTSMAAGVAAGTAALWWSHLRARSPATRITAEAVWREMKAGASASLLAPGTTETDAGLGLVQAPGLG